MEVGLTYDQLDITNSAMAEIIGIGGGDVGLDDDGSFEYFVGRDEAAGATAVAPGLRKHQSDKQERDVNVAKNQREPREELKGMPRKKDKNNPKGGGRGGAKGNEG